MISFLDCKQKPRPIVCHPQITFYLDRKLLALFNLSVFVIFKNGKKQDSRRRSVQKREHEIVQGYKYIYLWILEKLFLAAASYNSLEIQLKTYCIVIHRKPPVFKVKYFLKDYNNVQYITNLHNT